jgi:hypothetical protein
MINRARDTSPCLNSSLLCRIEEQERINKSIETPYAFNRSHDTDQFRDSDQRRETEENNWQDTNQDFSPFAGH